MKRVFGFVMFLVKEGFGFLTILRSDRAVFDREMVKAFDAAKVLSDFIGMIVRLIFAMVFVVYFYQKAIAAGDLWHRYQFGVPMSAGIFVTAYYGFLITRIVFEFFMVRMALHTNRWTRLVALLVALYFFWAVSNGILDIAMTLARATKLAGT